MLKKYIGAGLIALSLVLSVGAIATPAAAAGLTSTQISAIIGLLQSFGADAGIIANVQAALDGSSTNSTLSCSSFANVHYGNFDTSPGGPVSQLQSWLGISATSFGYGTYGPKTQAAWSAKCGGTQPTTQTNPVSSNSTGFTASLTSGAAPLSVQFNMNNGIVANPIVDFGDGTLGPALNFGIAASQNQDTLGHTYTAAGIYTAKFENSSGNVLAMQVITVTGSNSTQPSVLNATPTSGTAPLSVEFHINPGVASAYSIDFGDSKIGIETLGNGPGNSCGDPNESECAHTYTASGTYTVHIYDVKSEVLGTVTVTVN
jgi:PKD repeat protein